MIPHLRRPLDRRTLLRGCGAALALPWLESMAPPARRPQAGAPVRMAHIFMPNGVLPSAWTPATEGADYGMTPSLEPIAPFRDRVLVLTGLFNRNSLTGEGHYVKTTALLSGAPVKKTGGRDLEVGTSVDQVAAQALGHRTRLASLELGMDAVRTSVDMGYSTVYGCHISWRSPSIPATKEILPRLAFDRLFRSSRVGRRPEDASVLDVVLSDAKRLRRSVGGRDGQKLDEYLDSVRSLEARVEAFSGPSSELPSGPEGSAQPSMDGLADLEAPAEGKPDSTEAHADLMLDMIALAFQTDTTRLATFMFGNAVSGRNFSFLEGVEGGHHPLSHHENDPEKKRQYQLINRWHVERFARLMGKLDGMREGDGSVLDNSMIFLGSGIRDGNAHDPHDLPILVGGRGGGALATGRHVRYPRHTPLCGLHAAMLDVFGCPTDAFGDSDRRLDDLRT